jgi:simple sugar transport system permease protein
VLPWYLTFPLAILAASAVGAFWALIPAYLQAKRGSHIVITTIMFNFIAASAMVYLLVDVLKPAGSMAPQTRQLAEGAQLPKLGWVLEAFGFSIRSAPLNLAFLLALLMAFVVWVLIWRTKLGYEIRTYGFSPKAARYAGISETRIILVTMAISGGLAGMMSLNPIMGDQHNVSLDFVSGAGFVGIAVALMGRSHPAGIVPAAILFGMLYQGGAELAFEMPAISRDMIVIIQGLVILFAGALEHMFRPYVQTLFATVSPQAAGVVAPKGKGA